MGTHKQQKLQGSRRGNRKPRPNKMVIAQEGIYDHIENAAPDLLDAMWDDDTPLVGINIKLMDSGDWLCILKRSTGLKNQLVFSGSHDPIQALLRSQKGIENGQWKEEKPYKPK